MNYYQYSLYILAGPLLPLFFWSICLWLVIAQNINNAVYGFVWLGFFYAAFMAVNNFIPRTFRANGKTFYTDGLRLVHLRKKRKILLPLNNASIFFNSKDYTACLAICDALLADGHTDVLIYQLAAAAHINTKSYDRAYEMATMLAQHHQPDSNDLYNRGLICARQKKADERDEYFKKSLEADPNNAFTLNGVGYFLNVAERYAEAIPYFDKAIHIKADLSHAYNNRGHALIETGDHEGGLKDIQYSLELDNTNSYAYRNMGIYFMKMGDREKAIAALNKARELDPETDLIDELLQKAAAIPV